MSCSSHAKVLLSFEDAFIEAGERGGRLAAERATSLGLVIPYSDGSNLVEALPDGSIRIVKPLDPPHISSDSVESSMSLPTQAFDPREFDSSPV
jgi:hypothetical protein